MREVLWAILGFVITIAQIVVRDNENNKKG